MNVLRAKFYVLLLASGVLASSCSILKQEPDTYDIAWDDVVASESWKATLDPVPVSSESDKVYYAIPSYSPFESDIADDEFLQRYPAMVSRAYFRLISEAMDADQRISRSYQDMYRRAHMPGAAGNSILQREFELSQKRFLAHREMLEGLRSWNAFNDYGSDDLDFFMQEQLPLAYEKYERGVQEDELIDYLMRGLADLYHKKYGGLKPGELLPG